MKTRCFSYPTCSFSKRGMLFLIFPFWVISFVGSKSTHMNTEISKGYEGKKRRV
eukprot:UN33362